MYCPNCGKQISDRAKVCGYCGQKLRVKTPKTEPNKKVTKPLAPEKKASVGKAVPRRANDSKKSQQTTTKQEAAAGTKPRKRIRAWVWWVAGAVVVALGAWLAFSGFLDNGLLGYLPGQAANGSSIMGDWVATDFDGSMMYMEVRQQSGVYTLKYYDEMASDCGGVPASGNGESEGGSQSTVVIIVSYTCEGKGDLGTYAVTYHYDAATDTVREETLDPAVFITWERVK